METLKVDKSKLLDILKTNRDAHRETFLKAQVVYRDAVIHELDGMLKDARDGVAFRKHVNLVAPEDHTGDYNELIGLLELATDTFVDIDQVEYRNYVADSWSWGVKAKRINQAYATSNTSPMFVAENASFPSSSY